MMAEGGLTAPPDPRAARTPADFVAALGELRLWAGQPSLRTLRRLGGTTVAASGDTVDALPVSTTSYLLGGRGLPRLPRMEFVEAFVGACLRVAGRDEAAVTREVDRWREAWAAVARTTSAQTPIAESTMDGHDDADAVPLPPAAIVRKPAERGGRQRVVLAAVVAGVVVAGVVAAGVVAAGVVAWLQWDRHRLSAAAQPSAPVYRDGTITGLRDIDGMDLDAGKITQQNAPGTDISPWGRSNHLVTREHAMVLLLRGAGPETYARCVNAPVADRVVQIDGLHGLAPGSGLCVWTTDQRVALLTLTATPEPVAGSLAFRYVVWQP